MNTADLAGLSGALCEELAGGVEVLPRGESLLILLPFVDGHGDSLAIVVEDDVGGWILSDDGLAFHQVIELTGIHNPEAAIWRRMDEIATRHGVEFNGGQFIAEAADIRSVGRELLRLSAAISEALHVGRAAAPRIGLRFDEEVGLFLQDNKIPFVADQKVIGSSKAPHRVDFVIKNSKEIVAQAVASELSMRRALNIFYDLTEQSGEYIPVAFVDNEKSGLSNTTFTQLSYKANVFVWSQRARFLDYWNRAHQVPQDNATLRIPGTEQEA